MIEQKLAVGEFINFGDVSAARPQAEGTGEVSVGAQARTILVSRTFNRPKKRDTGEGENIEAGKEHRNFIWLPWAANAINYVESAGKDVLSGPFSGCYMIRYTVNGTHRIAHVSTPEAKAKWNEIAVQPGYVIEAGFKPFGADTEVPPAVGNDALPEIYGLITNTGALWTIVTWRQQERGGAGRLVGDRRIMSVTARQSLPVSVLTNLP